MKKHILLIENNQTEIEFFTNALQETHLSFVCSTARNTEQALKMLKSLVPDIIFFDIRMAEDSNFLLKLKTLQETQVIMYSTLINQPVKEEIIPNSHWLQLPCCAKTMSSVLENLLLDKQKVQHLAFADFANIHEA